MTNYLLKLRFDGSAFHGWQIQPGLDTVQQRVFDAATAVFGSHSPVYGCSRTDAGVHALEYCCNFRAQREIPVGSVPAAMNTKLPPQIAVLECKAADGEFHSQFNCAGKEYVYVMHCAPVADPFLNGRAWHIKRGLDAGRMNEAASRFIGTHDFAAFCASGSSVSSTVRTVKSAAVETRGDKVVFTVSADGFLYNMVRIMTGTLVAVSDGKMTPDDVSDAIESLDRERAGTTAPPQGLYLNRVFYDGGQGFDG